MLVSFNVIFKFKTWKEEKKKNKSMTARRRETFWEIKEENGRESELFQ